MTNNLIEALEKAEGPCRDLDLRYFCATAESSFEYYGGNCVLAVMGGFAARLDWEDIPHPTSSAAGIKEAIATLRAMGDDDG